MRRTYLFLLILAMPFIVISCKESTPSSPTTTTAATTTTTTSTSTTVVTYPVVIRETGEGFDNIQDAIDAAEDGHHIDVSVGTYTENLVIEKSLYLVGEERNTTIIDGRNLGSVIKFESDAEGSDIRGFTIKNGDSTGIDCDTSLTIGRNVIKDNLYFGITLDYHPVSISGVLVTDNENIGIWFGLSSPASVSEVAIKGGFDGSWCYGSPTIIACNITDNSHYGIRCMSGGVTNPDLGNGAGGSPGKNAIRNNGSYDVVNESVNAIKAENNYWDHTTVSEIDGLDIYDDNQNPAYGAVDFEPFLTSIVSLNSLRIKPRLLTASSLFKDFFRSLFRGDLPASAIYLSSSFEPKIHITRFELIRARYRPLVTERYYPPLELRAGRPSGLIKN
jgi:hypothetical protein